MTYNVIVPFYQGGGGNSLAQIIMAEQAEILTGQTLSSLSDIVVAGSAGNFAALTSILPNRTEGDQSAFTQLRRSFKHTAKQSICGILRKDQLVRTTGHDLHHSIHEPENPFIDPQRSGYLSSITQTLAATASPLLFKDKTGDLHLDPTPLRDLMAECFGSETTLNDLEKPFLNFAMHYESDEMVCFSNIDKRRPRGLSSGEWKDYFLPNHGGQHTVIDTVMASIAAPTLFPSHNIAGKNYIDCASYMSPLPVIKNIFEMAGKHKENVHIHILYMGTCHQSGIIKSADDYNKRGSIQTQRAYIDSTSLSSLGRDFREIRGHYPDCVTIHEIDIDLPTLYNDQAFLRDPFNGSLKYLNAIEEMTKAAIKAKPDIVVAPMERVAEAKNTSVDPLAAFDRSISPLIPIGKVRASHPAVAKPY